ncbi:MULTISPECIES: hypothetical protein [unclassified Paenibacillus]|uniref:hypothetical protein n=1 Tax=unclassified Paenibacillus TaxID=185978 RepID=UPI0011605E5D|nr:MULTISPECIES: hypothetical protein [unclassified Paenibacillus]
MMKEFPINDFEKISFLLLISGYAKSVGTLEGYDPGDPGEMHSPIGDDPILDWNEFWTESSSKSSKGVSSKSRMMYRNRGSGVHRGHWSPFLSFQEMKSFTLITGLISPRNGRVLKRGSQCRPSCLDLCTGGPNAAATSYPHRRAQHATGHA